MEEAERKVLSQFRARLASEIMVTESFLRALAASGVLDQRHVLDIKAASSPEGRVGMLVDVLMRGGHRALPGLLELLTSTNPWLAEKMRDALQEEKRQEAKLKLHASVNESGSIRSDAQPAAAVDNDIRQRVTRFLTSNLERLSEAQRRNLERWLCQELMTERRRQRASQEERNQAESVASQDKGKPLVAVEKRATQTDIQFQDLDDLFDQVVTTVHGSLGRAPDLSFPTFQQRVQELLRRVRDLEHFFLDCLRQFQESGHVGRNLPELISQTLEAEQVLRGALQEEHAKAEKRERERDAKTRQVRRLEQEMEKLYLRQAVAFRAHRPDYHYQRQKTLDPRQPVSQTARVASSPRPTRGEAGKPEGIAGKSVETRRLSPRERPTSYVHVQRSRSTSGDGSNAGASTRLHQSNLSKASVDRQLASKTKKIRFS